MSTSFRFGVLGIACIAVLAGPVRAETHFKATITHDQEVPGIPDEGASGTATFVLNDAQNAFSYHIQLFGLDLDGNQTPANANDNVTRTHFHAAPAGVNGGIVFGQIDGSATLRNDLDDLVVNAAAGTIDGVWDNAEGNGTTLGAQLANLFAHGLYFNVHTADHGGGEVRGQVVIVPEPSTLIAGLGLAGLSLGRRRNR